VNIKKLIGLVQISCACAAILALAAAIILAPLACFLRGMSIGFAPPQPRQVTSLGLMVKFALALCPVGMTCLGFLLNFYTRLVRIDLAYIWLVVVLAANIAVLAWYQSF
jgi:hypothetical protein